MDVRSLGQRSCCSLSTRGNGGQRNTIKRNVRTAFQLRQSFEQAPIFYELHHHEAAYQKGYEDGLLEAQRQQLAVAAQASAAAAAAAPLVAAAIQDTAKQQRQQQQQEEQPCSADSVLRTAVKGLSWRIFSTSTTILLAFVVLGGKVRWNDTLKLGLFEFVSKYILYFVHERLWAAIRLIK